MLYILMSLVFVLIIQGLIIISYYKKINKINGVPQLIEDKIRTNIEQETPTDGYEDRQSSNYSSIPSNCSSDSSIPSNCSSDSSIPSNCSSDSSIPSNCSSDSSIPSNCSSDSSVIRLYEEDVHNGTHMIYHTGLIQQSNIKESQPEVKFGEKNFTQTSSYVMIGDDKVSYVVNNTIQLKCFASTISFSYDYSVQDAIYKFKPVSSLWSNIVDGLVMVENNGNQEFYSFESGYSSETKTLTLTILDGDGKVLILNGFTRVSLVLCDCVDSVIVQQNLGFSIPLLQADYVSR